MDYLYLEKDVSKMKTLIQSQIEDIQNYPMDLQNLVTDHYVKVFVTAWFWPYFVMGNADTWQKLGITMNGVGPIKC